jgi:hypothetical protein
VSIYFKLVRSRGLDLSAVIPQVTEAITQAAAAALTVEGENIIAASKEIVPLDQGVLRASADAVGINVTSDGKKVTAQFGYGGAASSYAIIQHENPFFTHAEGRTWKYLEIPTMAAVDGMEARLADALRSDIEGAL